MDSLAAILAPLGVSLGMVVTGLNYQIGGSPPQIVLGTGNIDIDFNSNNVRRALQSFAGFVPIENAWADNWATW